MAVTLSRKSPVPIGTSALLVSVVRHSIFFSSKYTQRDTAFSCRKYHSVLHYDTSGTKCSKVVNNVIVDKKRRTPACIIVNHDS